MRDPWDFLATYVVPEDLWYIIPWPVLDGQASVQLRPARDDSKYAKYLGAWELLKRELLNQNPPKKDPRGTSDLSRKEVAASASG